MLKVVCVAAARHSSLERFLVGRSKLLGDILFSISQLKIEKSTRQQNWIPDFFQIISFWIPKLFEPEISILLTPPAPRTPHPAAHRRVFLPTVDCGCCVLSFGIPHPYSTRITKINSWRSLHYIFLGFLPANILSGKRVKNRRYYRSVINWALFSVNKLRWSDDNLPPHTILIKFGIWGLRTDHF